MKKWTYLVVAGLLAGATPMLQSCVDNDEPEGINVLRKAKAELIAAKKIVQEAEAARLKAEAAKLEADAALVKAQAEIAKAQADLVNAQTEAARAEIEIRIAQAKAEAEHQQKVWEQQDKLAEVAYQTALAELAKVKAAVNEKQQQVLQAYINKVDRAKKKYDTAMNNVRKKQRNLLKATEEMNDREANKDYWTRDAQRDVKEAQLNLDEAKATLEALQAELELAKTLDLEGTKERIEELEKEMVAQMAVMEKAVLELAEKQAEYQPELAALALQVTEAKNAEIEIEEFKYEFPYYLVSSYQGEYPILDATSYSYLDDDNYQTALGRLSEVSYSVEKAKLSPNDKAWAADDVANYKGMAADCEEEVAQLKEEWQKAVEAYNAGAKYATIKGAEGYDEFVEAVKVYNENVKTYTDAVAAYDAYFADKSELTEDYDAKKKAAEEKRDEAKKANQAEFQATKDAFRAQLNVLNANATLAEKKWKEAEAQLALKANPTTEEREAVDALEDAYNELAAEAYEYYSHWYFDWTNDANETVEAGLTQANNLLTKKNNLADATYDREEAAAAEELASKLKALGADSSLVTELSAARTALNRSYNDAQTLFNSIVRRDYDYYYGNCTALYKAFFNYVEDENGNSVQTPLSVEVNDELANINKYLTEEVLANKSARLFGYEKSNWSEFWEKSERLVELTKEEIDAELAEQGVEPWEYYKKYSNLVLVDRYYYTYTDPVTGEEVEDYDDIYDYKYGKLGLLLYYQAMVERAEAILAGDTELDKILETIAAEEEKLVANYDANAALVEAAQAAYEEKVEEVDMILWDLNIAAQKAEYQYGITLNLYSIYIVADSAINEVIDGIKSNIETAENDVFRYEGDLADRQKDLEEWNSTYVDKVEQAQEKLEDAQAEAEVAKENLDIATERLQKAIEAMAVAAE